MLRRNATLSGLLLAAALAVGCEAQNKAEVTVPDQPAKVTIETPPPAAMPVPQTEPPAAMTPPAPVEEEAAPAAAPAKPLPKESYAKKPSSSKSRVYTVKSGDTLQGIAKKYYNDPKKWRTIYEANRRQIKDPNKIPVGKKLIVP